MFDGVGASSLFDSEGMSPDIDLLPEQLELLTGSSSYALHFGPEFSCEIRSSLTLTVRLEGPSPPASAFVVAPFATWAEPKPDTFFPAGKASLSEGYSVRVGAYRTIGGESELLPPGYKISQADLSYLESKTLASASRQTIWIREAPYEGLTQLERTGGGLASREVRAFGYVAEFDEAGKFGVYPLTGLERQGSISYFTKTIDWEADLYRAGRIGAPIQITDQQLTRVVILHEYAHVWGITDESAAETIAWWSLMGRAPPLA